MRWIYAVVITLGFLVGLVSVAAAHHGWAWAEAQESTMEAVIEEVTIAPPHPSLKVRDAEGVVWEIELSNPARTQRAGFVEGVAEVGDSVVILGNRSLDAEERVMKAVRITLEGQNYDFYPERIDE
jgi:hypothetical protein